MKHKKVARQAQNKNNLIFEKRTQPKQHKKKQEKQNINVNTKQDLSKKQHEIILPSYTREDVLSMLFRRPNPPCYNHAL